MPKTTLPFLLLAGASICSTLTAITLQAASIAIEWTGDAQIIDCWVPNSFCYATATNSVDGFTGGISPYSASGHATAFQVTVERPFVVAQSAPFVLTLDQTGIASGEVCSIMGLCSGTSITAGRNTVTTHDPTSDVGGVRASDEQITNFTLPSGPGMLLETFSYAASSAGYLTVSGTFSASLADPPIETPEPRWIALLACIAIIGAWSIKAITH